MENAAESGPPAAHLVAGSSPVPILVPTELQAPEDSVLRSATVLITPRLDQASAFGLGATPAGGMDMMVETPIQHVAAPSGTSSSSYSGSTNASVPMQAADPNVHYGGSLANEVLNVTARPSDVHERRKKDKKEKREKKDKRSSDRSIHSGGQENYNIRPFGKHGDNVIPADLNTSYQGLPGAAGTHSRGGHMGPHVVVSVKGMSPIEPDIHVVHPFVRLFVIDGRTGMSYVPTSDASVDCVTYPFDLRTRQTLAPLWNDEVPVPVTDAAIQLDADPILLLEVLDFGSSTIQGQYDHGRRGFYRIAWGFLRLKSILGDDLSLKSTAAAHMQLFFYTQESFGPLLSSLLQWVPSWFAHPAMHAPQPYFPPPPQGTTTTPDVFFIYANASNRKIAYPGGIALDVGYAPANVKAPPMTHTPSQASLYELQLLQQLLAGGAEAGKTIEVISKSLAQRTREISDNPHVSLDYRRSKGERVVPPSVLIHESRIHGTITAMSFSGSGKLLALAVSSNLQTVIDIRDVLSNRFSTIGLLRGHADLVHHVAFSQDESLLVTCSSDKTAKVWAMSALPCIVTSSIEEAHVCLCTLPHSFPVYCGIFYQGHVVCAGYDTQLHVWKVDALQRSSKLTAVVPNPSTAFFLHLASCDDSRIWTIDSAGMVTAWRAVPDETQKMEITQMSVRRRLECKGATSISLAGLYGFLPCPRDGACYVIELSSFTLLHRVHGIAKEPNQGFCLLPDGKTFVAGNKNGRMMAWETTSGDMCSSREGAARGQVAFPVSKISWAATQQLCAVASSSAAFDSNTGASSLTGEQVEPADSCIIAILGEPRSEERVVLESDPRSIDFIRSMFGGEISAFRASIGNRAGGATPRGLALPTASAASRGPIVEDRGASRHGDKATRMEQILGFWKNLVGGQKKKTAASSAPLTRV